MSAKQLTKSQIATDWVRNHSKANGLDRFVLLIFAFYVNKETGLSYPTVETVAREIGKHRSTAFRRITNLIDLGELEPVAHHGHGATEYRIVGPDYESSSSRTPATRTDSPVAPLRLGNKFSSRKTEGSSRNLEPSSRNGASLPLYTSKETSTTSNDDPRLEDAVKRCAHHRSSLPWVEKQIAVRLQTVKALSAHGGERDALNEWLLARPDVTADDAGKAYAEDAIPGTERYEESDHCVRRAPGAGQMFQSEEEANAYYDSHGMEKKLSLSASYKPTGPVHRSQREQAEADVRLYRQLGEEENADEMQALIDAGEYGN